MKAPYESFYRVWLSLSQTPVQHEKLHAAIWKPNIDEARVIRLLAESVSRSEASDDDRVAVLNFLAEDWQIARVLASMASSCTVSASDNFANKLSSLIADTGLSVSAFAEKHNLNQQTIQNYTSGNRRPTWDMVQQLAKALGVPTDTFRDRS